MSSSVLPGPVIRVFEPALCCNTGVCGPELDERLVAFTADLDYLRGLGVDIDRHNLANDPGAFAADVNVSAFLRVAGSAGLPVVLVNGITVATARYPARSELSRYAGIAAEDQAAGAHRDLGLSPVTPGVTECCVSDHAYTAAGPGCC